MANHKIPTHLIDPLTSSPSPSKITQVATLQNYIQELLEDTHHTFLQGSYKNGTAISDINDVDIVAVRKTTFSSVHSSRRFSSSISWDSIFSEIEQKLRGQRRYQWTIERGDKCIKITGAFNADVVPAVQISDDPKIDPVAVYSMRTGVEKMNKPRTHYDNGVVKQQVTKETYKPTVRMFKNWVKNHFHDSDTISSFKMEAFVHAMPPDKFYNDYAGTFCLVGSAILDKWDRQLGQFSYTPSVCGVENIIEGWSVVDQQNFLNQLLESSGHALDAYNAPTISEAEQKWRLALGM